MIKFEEDMFVGSDERWQKLYAQGLAWCVSGIKGLESSGINPYHQATPPYDSNDARKIVYAVYDNSSNGESPDYCFFEDDYINGFRRFSEMKSAKLLVSYLRATSDCPTCVWNDNKDYIDNHHGNSKHWSQQLNSWQI